MTTKTRWLAKTQFALLCAALLIPPTAYAMAQEEELLPNYLHHQGTLMNKTGRRATGLEVDLAYPVDGDGNVSSPAFETAKGIDANGNLMPAAGATRLEFSAGAVPNNRHTYIEWGSKYARDAVIRGNWIKSSGIIGAVKLRPPNPAVLPLRKTQIAPSLFSLKTQLTCRSLTPNSKSSTQLHWRTT